MEMGSAFPHLIINNNNSNNNNSCWLSDPLVKRTTHGGHDFYHRAQTLSYVQQMP
jgi:hypothetical protein